eukprot:11721516-Alexandrium_andersonii.AAC.1
MHKGICVHAAWMHATAPAASVGERAPPISPGTSFVKSSGIATHTPNRLGPGLRSTQLWGAAPGRPPARLPRPRAVPSLD